MNRKPWGRVLAIGRRHARLYGREFRTGSWLTCTAGAPPKVSQGALLSTHRPPLPPSESSSTPGARGEQSSSTLATSAQFSCLWLVL